MPKVSIMIPGSPNDAFYSQIAAIERSLSQLHWTRWEPQVHVSFGGKFDPATHERWARYLRNTRISFVPEARHERDDNWAQCDDVVEMTPCNSDVILDMDADTLPVANFEDILDQVLVEQRVAGVTAHYPPGGSFSTEQWAEFSQRIARVSLDFDCRYTLVDSSEDIEKRRAPFYLNFGVVFFPGKGYDRLAREFLRIRTQIANQLTHSEYSAQIALTLALAKTGDATLSLPMRFNYPNDPTADRLHPDELCNVRIFHYLRHQHFDRHKIFVNTDEYASFMQLPLEGSNAVFRDSVGRLLGIDYPFG